MSCMSVTLITVSMSQSHVGDLVAAGDAAVDVEHGRAGLDLVRGQGLDELGVARLDRLGDLLARPVDRFTHQQHFDYLHDDYPGRTTEEYMRTLVNQGTGASLVGIRWRRRGAGQSPARRDGSEALGRRDDPVGTPAAALAGAPLAVGRAARVPAALGDAAVDPDHHVVTALEQGARSARYSRSRDGPVTKST